MHSLLSLHPPLWALAQPAFWKRVRASLVNSCPAFRRCKGSIADVRRRKKKDKKPFFEMGIYILVLLYMDKDERVSFEPTCIGDEQK